MSSDTLFFLPGNHLYPHSYLQPFSTCHFLMVEDLTICQQRAYHQQKLGLVLSAMREYADSLQRKRFKLQYHHLEDAETITSAVTKAVERHGITELHTFEISDNNLTARLSTLSKNLNIHWQVQTDPGFLSSKDTFRQFCKDKQTVRMANFYRQQRRQMKVLMDNSGQPSHGKWSFDEYNRKNFPRRSTPPPQPDATHSKLTSACLTEVATRFDAHPGDARQLWLPTTRSGALRWLQDFLENRLLGFGTYEDAISQRSETLHHSTLSPLINLGLLTPREVVKSTLKYADAHSIPINDLEGFLRQIIGWREFIRGIYSNYGDRLRQENVRQQHRSLTRHWHDGTTGLPPLDHAIVQQHQLGWNHHINRLMVIATLMNLCDIAPGEVYEYFMTNYIDAYAWVMVPNVYGMGLNSDSGVFATKPYICGSNYILKMSDFSRGEWCDVWDGLYWRFAEKHRPALSSNNRMAPVLRNLDRLSAERRARIFSAAESFLDTRTVMTGTT